MSKHIKGRLFYCNRRHTHDMKQRILSFFLALLTLFGLFSTAAFAADTPEAALGEVNI